MKYKTDDSLLMSFFLMHQGDTLYWLKSRILRTDSAMSISLNNNYTLWHNRFGHPGMNVMKNLSKGVKGVSTFTISLPTDVCRGCALGKMTAKSYPSSEKRASKPLELVHYDLKEFPIESYHKYKWVIIFLDDYSSFPAPYFLKQKSQALATFKEYIAWAEKQTSFELKTV